MENIDIESVVPVGWTTRANDVHAIHFCGQLLDDRLLQTARLTLNMGFRPDFWVLNAQPLADRMGKAHFLEKLEIILEMLQGRGIKVALRPADGWAPSLVSLLKTVRCDVTGYCWHEGIGEDLECISDRIFCAVGKPGGRYHALMRYGYRWNVAIPGSNVVEWQSAIRDLESAHETATDGLPAAWRQNV